MVEFLALDLAGTIRHDGHGGVTDDLTTPEELTTWVHDRANRLGPWATGFHADDSSHTRVIAVRQAIRTLFAHTAHPTPPLTATAAGRRPPPLGRAVDRVNAAAALVPITPRLVWLDEEPSTHFVEAAHADALSALAAALARSTIDLLTGPHRADLRACTAPRCVRYFLKSHGRQEFCKPSCGNRARAARHYRRQRETSTGPK